MRDDEIRLYYERELNFLRQMGREFAEKYPGIAHKLLLEPDKCEDPHVERMLEGFAFLAARVHLKIDDEFPEITEALLNVLYPHYLRPVPSMSIVQFHLDPDDGGLTTPQLVPRESMLKSRRIRANPGDDQSVATRCYFRTCFETNVLPITVTGGEWKTPDRLNPPVKTNDAVGALRVEFKAPQGVTFRQLGTKSLRFFISGDGNLSNTIYELLFANCVQILVRDPSNMRFTPIVLRPEEVLKPIGFAPDEGMFPYPRRSFDGYRLLQEYFSFPEKFLFFEVGGLDQAFMQIKDKAEIVFLISAFEQFERRQNLELGVNSKTFKLNCCPIINLFKQMAEPIKLDQRKFEYQVVPDVTQPLATEVYSIEEVTCINSKVNSAVKYDPFYSYRHTTIHEKRQTFWMAHRRGSGKKNDQGVEIFLSLVDLSKRVVQPDADVLSVRALCTNRDLPARLPFGDERYDFELEGSATVKRIVCLLNPTPTVRPPTGKGAFWRLISHLTLNYLSLTDQAPVSPPGQRVTAPAATDKIEDRFPGREAFKELMKLYNYAGAAHTEKQIEGILKIHGSRQFARLFSENGIVFVRGTRIELELDEEQFAGGGALLFSAVIEQFLTLYASMNSFTQLSVRTKQRKDLLKEWPPRAGQKILL